MKTFHLNSASPFIIKPSSLDITDKETKFRQLEPDASEGNISFLVFDVSIPKKAIPLGRLQGGPTGILLRLPDDLHVTSMGKPVFPMADDFDASKGILKHHMFGMFGPNGEL